MRLGISNASGSCRRHAPRLAPAVWLLAALLAAAGCTPPGPDAWPRVNLLIDEQAWPILAGGRLEIFARGDGTIIEPRIETAERIGELLGEGGHGADLLMTMDMELWEAAERSGWLAPQPWRFHMTRTKVMVVADAASPEATLEQLLGPDGETLAVVHQLRSPTGPMIRLVLGRSGLWDQERILECRGPAAALAAVRRGDAAAAALGTSSRWRLEEGRWRVIEKLDPHPQWPMSLGAGVLADSERPVLARRAWNFLEFHARRTEIRLTPTAGDRAEG